MSFAAEMARDMLLTARNNDLELQMNQLTENLMQLQSVASSLFSLTSNMMPGSAQAQIIEVRQAQLAEVEKGIDMRLELVKAQQKAVTTEMDAVRKVISDDIQRSFKTFANG